MGNMLPSVPFVMFLFVRENSNSTDSSNKSFIISQKEFRIRQTPGLANALTQRYNQRSDSFHFSTLPLTMCWLPFSSFSANLCQLSTAASSTEQYPKARKRKESFLMDILNHRKTFSKAPLQTFPPSSGPGLYYSSSKPFTLRGLELIQLTKINQGIYWALEVAISPKAPDCLRSNLNWGSVKQEGKEWLFSG